MHHSTFMRTNSAGLIVGLLIASSAAYAQGETQKKSRALFNGTACGDPLAFQVLLDQHGFSPGEIDGQLGPNAQRALAAFQQEQAIAVTGEPDCPTWRALGG